jgi:hypothetical protein
MDKQLNTLATELGQPVVYSSVAAATTLTLGAVWILNDYHAWLAFGTGGTPANFSGYLKITKFRLMRIWAGDDLKDPSSLASIGPSYLSDNLPRRTGSPPKIISRTLPQRQFPSSPPIDKAILDRLHGLPRKYADLYPDDLILDKSITEGRTTDAIYAKPDRKFGAHDRALGDEIAHVHPSEDSMHIWLTQADAKKVVAAGWGERFPLASLHMVDSGWTFMYAPRTMEDVDVIEKVVKAGIGHLTGKRLE